MQAELDIMMRTAASGCSLQVVEPITVLKYSMSTDLLFSKDILFQLLATLIIDFLFSAVESKIPYINLLKQL